MAALLDVRRRVAVRAVGLTPRQPVVAPVVRRAERHGHAVFAVASGTRFSRIPPLALVRLLLLILATQSSVVQKHRMLTLGSPSGSSVTTGLSPASTSMVATLASFVNGSAELISLPRKDGYSSFTVRVALFGIQVG